MGSCWLEEERPLHRNLGVQNDIQTAEGFMEMCLRVWRIMMPFSAVILSV
jgi:hypothetical protein